MQTEIHIQPTIFLYLGTSSSQVGVRLKRHIDAVYGSLPILRHLWIDVNSAIEDPDVAAWFSPMERAELAGFNADDVLANLNAFPSIKAWWPRDSRVRPGFVRDGANQIRLVGRLALFRMFSDRSAGPSFIDKLRQVTEAVRQIENIDRTEKMSTPARRYIVDRGSVRVYVILTTCGGSGSAISADVAYLTRYHLRGSNPTLIGVGMLPPVVDTAIKNETQTQKEKIRAHTYTWFKEDNFLRENPHWRASYPEGAPVEIHAPPFDLQFVVDLGNQAGDRLNSADDIYAMIAQAIFLDTGSSIGGAIRGFNANVSVLGEEFRGRRRAYSSLAAASLIYPGPKILAYCTASLSREMLQAGLLGKADRGQVMEAAAALLGRNQLRDSALLELLLSGRQIAGLNSTAIRKATSVESVRTLLATQEQQDAQARQVQIQRMEKVADEARSALVENLEEEVVRTVIQRGAPFATLLLELLASPSVGAEAPESIYSLAGFRARLLQQGVSENDVIQAEQEYAAARAQLQQLEGGLWKGLRKRVQARVWRQEMERIVNDCLHWQGAINQRTLQLAAQRIGVDIYDQLLEQVRSHSRALSQVQQVLTRTGQRLAEEAEARLKPATAAEGVFELSLEAVDAAYIRSYYQGQSKGIAALAAYQGLARKVQLSTLAGLEEWVGKELSVQLGQEARGYFAPKLEKTSLLEAMAEHYGPEAPRRVEEQFDRLVRYCHPFWQYSRDSGILGQEGKSIIGVEDEHSELIPPRYRDSLQYEIKSTGFRHRIDVARIQHGLPAFLLRGMDDYRAYYEAKRKGLDPLHVIPGAALADDLFPEEKQESRRSFALAAAFGYVVRVGSWYYFDPRREYEKSKIHPGRENQLENGREKAEDVFILRDEAVRLVDQLIEQEIVEMGNRAAIEFLDGRIAEHKETIARMPIENELRRQYEKEILALEAKQRQLGRITPELELLAA